MGVLQAMHVTSQQKKSKPQLNLNKKKYGFVWSFFSSIDGLNFIVFLKLKLV